MNKRLYYMDIVRLMAVGLVMFAHFVIVGTFEPKLPDLINHSKKLPILNSHSHHLYYFESLLNKLFHTQSGIVGVLLFFLVTGYLITMMQARYSRRKFVINRLFRIYPALLFSTIIAGIWLYYTEDISFPLERYIATITLTYGITHISPILGIVWTLVIEMLFYFAATLAGKFTVKKLFVMQSILLTMIILNIFTGNDLILFLAYNARFMLYIAIGIAIKLSELLKNKKEKFFLISSAFIISFIGFQIFMLSMPDIELTTYRKLGSQLLALGLFLFFYSNQTKMSRFFDRLPNFIYNLSDMVYSIYLIHLPIGMTTMIIIRQYTTNTYVILLGAVAASLLAAAALHYTFEKPFIQYGRKINKKIQH